MSRLKAQHAFGSGSRGVGYGHPDGREHQRLELLNPVLNMGICKSILEIDVYGVL